MIAELFSQRSGEGESRNARPRLNLVLAYSVSRRRPSITVERIVHLIGEGL